MIHQSIEQLKLYPPETKFTVKAKNFETGEIKILKDQTVETYSKSSSFLKYLNANGYNIFLSPSVAGGVYILLDDLKKQDVDKLYQDCFEPFYFLQTSPENYQAILKLSDLPVDNNIQTFISRQLAEIYNADLNSSDIWHFFRLAGYTNRKEKYCKNGLFPFVKLFLGTGKVCTKGQSYIDRILAGIESGLIELSGSLELPERNTATPPERRGERKTLETGCSAYIKKVYESGGNASDISGLDFKAAYYAIRKGFTQDEIKSALLKFSPDIAIRKRGHIEDYISRTVKNALAK